MVISSVLVPCIERVRFWKSFVEHYQAVHLAQQSGNTNQGIASDLGISQSALSSWIKAAKEHGSLAFPGQGVARLTPEQETIKRLERELVTLRQEREILKSAAIWFAKETR